MDLPTAQTMANRIEFDPGQRASSQNMPRPREHGVHAALPMSLVGQVANLPQPPLFDNSKPPLALRAGGNGAAGSLRKSVDAPYAFLET